MAAFTLGGAGCASVGSSGNPPDIMVSKTGSRVGNDYLYISGEFEGHEVKGYWCDVVEIGTVHGYRKSKRNDPGYGSVKPGAKVSEEDKKRNWSRVAEAAGETNAATLYGLLSKPGASANATFRDKTALMHAAYEGYTDNVKLLLRKGADVNARGATLRTGGVTALMLAANSFTKDESIEIIKALLAAGADINARDYAGKSAVDYAAEGKRIGSLRVLLENGAARDDAALMAMSPQIASLLMELGTDVNAKDKNGTTALMRAVEFNEDKKQYNPQTQVVKSLLEKGADVNARDAKGWTALDYVEHGEKHAIASDETQTAATEELASNYGPIMGALVRSAASLGADMHGMKVKKEEWAEAKRLLVAAGARKSGAGLQAGEKAVVAESQVREDLLGAMREAKKNVAPILAPIKSVDETVTECITGGEGCKVEGVSIQADCTDVIWSGCNIKMKVSPLGGRDYSGESWTGQGAGLIIPKEELKPGHHAYTMTFLDVDDRVFGVCSGTFHLDGNETRVFIGFDKDDVKRGKCDAYISKQ